MTSTAFTKTPVPSVADFIRRHPVEDDFTKVWERTLPASAYLYESPAIGGAYRGGNVEHLSTPAEGKHGHPGSGLL